MTFCEKCGSSSRDKDGFCGGCGASWPLPPAGLEPHGATAARSPYAALPARMNAMGLAEVRPKIVWVAVVLGLLFGPVGLLYCTLTGTIVMLIVSIALRLLFGEVSLLVSLPACAFWAWRAARQSVFLSD